MRLYILRHGDAPYDHRCGERVLSHQGASDTQKIVRRHLAELAATAMIICSPTRRARETFSVVKQTLGDNKPVLFDDCLRSGSSVAAVGAYLDQLDSDGALAGKSLLMVSHQPLVGELLDYLTDSYGVGRRMGTSCLANLDLLTFSRGCGKLNWLDYPGSA